MWKFMSLVVLALISACVSPNSIHHLASPDRSNETILIRKIFDDYHAYTQSFSRGDSLEFVSADHQLAQLPQLRSFLNQISSASLRNLTPTDSLSALVLAHDLRDQIEYLENHYFVLPLTGWFDYHTTFANLTPSRDTLAYLVKLADFPRLNREYIDLMRRGIRAGLVRPKEVFPNYLPTIEAHISDVPEESPWGRALCKKRDVVCTLTPEQADLVESVIDEYRFLLDFLRNEYIPAGSDVAGIRAVPGGEAYYRYLVRHHVTFDISPDSVHAIGKREVARIRAEMDVAMRKTGFEGDFSAFLEFLRTDPRFYPTSPDELMMRTSLVLKKMDGQLPNLFGRLPRLPYGIIEIPAYMAPRMTTAYYSPGSVTANRAGNYAVNTYNLPSRPMYEIEALSFHEAVPGHHLQIALAQELDLPAFRRGMAFTAYTEGWALYSERLGLEVGFYTDPYSDFGRLSYEMWRALRLVVDTGIHWYGWTQEEAIEYMAVNSALSMHNIRSEVMRYTFWPGQALAYKMGEIHIRRLRAEQEASLGDTFDLRAFHDAILGTGGIPLQLVTGLD